VPIFADPIEWDNHRSYESLTIVTHDGESYTSKCNVGPGVDITNTRYWAKTGAYNAQVEQYKNEVKDLSSQVSGFASDNAEFREKINQFTKDNAEMKNTVAEDKARVDALAERVATAETEIDGLQATTAQHTTEIADLHAKDEDLQRQITSNDGDIAALQAKDVEHDSRLNGIDTKLKSHDASIAQNTADIAKNTKNIQDNAAAIAKNAHELADHAEQLADHEGRLTAQHEEITANHQAIERLTSVTDGLRSDLTEDEAKIESNRDAIAHIQEKDVQQDSRLDALENRATNAEGRLDGLDTKTDKTNTALTAEIDRAKAAELANGKLIAKNAAELAAHATELADHETRISTLESDNTTNKQEITDIKAKNTQQDTAIAGNTDAIQHLTESTGDFVTKTAFNTDQKRQDDNVGDWATAHPGQTIAECATSQETELAEHAASIAKLETDKADKSEIPDVTGYVPTSTYNEGQAAQDARINTLEKNSVSLPDSVRYNHVEFSTVWPANDEREANYATVILPFPFKTFPTHPEPATVSDVAIGYAEVVFLDGTPVHQIEHSDVTVTAEFDGAGVRLTASVPDSAIPSDTKTRSHIFHFAVRATIS
jgi:chromosome segregation ATPase